MATNLHPTFVGILEKWKAGPTAVKCPRCEGGTGAFCPACKEIVESEESVGDFQEKEFH